MKYILSLLVAVVFVFSLGTEAQAADSQTFTAKTVIGDGANGRVFNKWTQGLSNRGVDRIEVRMRRQRGGNDTYVNLRFGKGKTLENGKREYLRNSNSITATWRVGGQNPNGQPLVLNAYKGEVLIEKVEVYYVGSAAHKPRSKRHSSDDDNDSYADDDSVAQEETAAGRRCRDARIKRPRIEISRVKPSGGLFSGKYKIEGVVSGNCIEEAGYYESGRLKEEIAVPLSDRFKRKDFTIKARSGKKGELRVYTTDGREDIIEVDDEIKDSGALY